MVVGTVGRHDAGAPCGRQRRPTGWRWALAVALAAASAGCGRHPRPWDGPADGGTAGPVGPWLPPTAGASWLGDAGRGVAGNPDAGGGPSPVGGLWVSCYGGFHPSGEPLRDVTRLGLLCGPCNGMQRVGDGAWTGHVAQGQGPVRRQLRVRRGDCYRIFAVADEGVADLDVTVRTSRGTSVAADLGEDRWPIVQPERPFCTFEDDAFTIELGAKRGAGAFAVEIWALTAGPSTPAD